MITSPHDSEVQAPTSERLCRNSMCRPSICFVALHAYNVLSGREDLQHIGGAEVQQVRMASWLAHRGYPVRFVTLDHGQPDGLELRGMKVFKAYAKADGMRGLRFLHPRWSGLWSALSRADADVYYHRCAEAETGQVALWCHLHRRKFIFGSASDASCDPPLFASEHSWVERGLYRVGIKLAHAIAAQTKRQQDLFCRNMKVRAVLIRNCGWDLGGCTIRESRPDEDRTSSLRVLWVGRISREKRLEWLLDIAEACPDVAFAVVGVAGVDNAYASSLVKRAADLPNVRMCGYVPHGEMVRYYQDCHILCCTSVYEGFPNTFLEAWSQGIPVISTFDPDGVIAANGLGWVAGDVDGMMRCLRRTAENPETRMEASRVAQQYFIANHTPEVCLPAFERVLLEVAGAGGCAR